VRPGKQSDRSRNSDIIRAAARDQIPAIDLGVCHYADMAYDEGLATRIRALIDDSDVVEKKMFGGLGILIGGNMAVGVYGDELLVRTDPAKQDELLAEPGARMFDMVKSRPMNGWILVSPEHCAEDEDLARWVGRGVAHARALPPKP
jgi:TfoX/Sxy family transcriptional regulator of competence genes